MDSILKRHRVHKTIITLKLEVVSWAGGLACRQLLTLIIPIFHLYMVGTKSNQTKLIKVRSGSGWGEQILQVSSVHPLTTSTLLNFDTFNHIDTIPKDVP